MSAPLLETRELTFGYRPNEPILNGLNLQSQKGSLLCLLGPNGSGKTSLLRCLLGQLTPQSGDVLLDGTSLSELSIKSRAQHIAYVPQQPRCDFNLPVREIILTGRLAHTGMFGLAGKRDMDVAAAAMEMTGTREFADRTLDELSGGEAQRVMIARALAQQPEAILLDEPTSHLDIKHQLRIYEMMRLLAHDWKMAVICVSHDINLAARFADRLCLMRRGELLASGGPQKTLTPELIHELYQVKVDLMETPYGPMILAKETEA